MLDIYLIIVLLKLLQDMAYVTIQGIQIIV